jgi:hypothetical protein
MADVDDDSCEFSRGVFYRSLDKWREEEIIRIDLYGSYPNEPVSRLEDGDFSWVYPTERDLNCNSPGVIKLKFEDGRKFEWYVEIFTTDSSVIYGNSGIVEPNPNSDCVKVDVTL